MYQSFQVMYMYLYDEVSKFYQNFLIAYCIYILAEKETVYRYLQLFE